MSSVIFFIAAIGAVGGAVGTVSVQNAFYSVLALVVHLISLAALFLLLRAEFIAAAQVIVYAGAVMVLYVFVVAYVGGMEGPLAAPTGRFPRVISALFAAALFVELCIALIGAGLKALDTDGAPYRLGFGTPGSIGRSLLTTYLVAFEAASLLLLVAAVGAVILARRRAGIPDTGEVSVADIMRSREATLGEHPPETMLEAGGPAGR
jgi:NADH:ubiquinone oxidoreductase subunit 6 (subunit J)